MVFKPSSVLRDRPASNRLGSGDAAFRFFLAVAVIGCLWTTVIEPSLPALSAWISRLLGA